MCDKRSSVSRMTTVGSCCGHGIYPETILIRSMGGRVKVYGEPVWIPRTRRFYRSDEDGFYFIPELQAAKRTEREMV